MEIAAGKTGDCSGVARIFLQNLAIELRSRGNIALLERICGGGKRILDSSRAFLPCGAKERLHELAELAFWNRTHEAIDRLAVLESIDGRNGLDAQLLRDLRVFVDIDLDETKRALSLGHEAFEQRAQLFARAAPGRPEINDHGHVHRRVQHVGGETGQ